MANLQKHAELVTESNFQTRVRAATIQAAVLISGEDTDPTHAKSIVRQAFATKVLQGSIDVDALCWIVGSNSTILSEYVGGGVTAIPDGDIEFVMATIWDDISGAASIAPPA